MNPITIKHDKTETICALATPHGSSAIAIIRISGPKSIEVCEKIFRPKNKKIKLSKVNSHTQFILGISLKI